MNSRNIFVMTAVIAWGLLSPIAMADQVNSYFSTPTNPMKFDEVTTSSPVLIEGDSAPLTVERSAPVVIERTLSSPVVMESTGSPPVLLEDRIIKQKHAFGLGIWPLFDFEIM